MNGRTVGTFGIVRCLVGVHSLGVSVKRGSTIAHCIWGVIHMSRFANNALLGINLSGVTGARLWGVNYILQHLMVGKSQKRYKPFLICPALVSCGPLPSSG